jgi:hypothetical protein
VAESYVNKVMGTAEHIVNLEIDGKKHKASFETGTVNKKGRTLKAMKVTFVGVRGALYLD